MIAVLALAVWAQTHPVAEIDSVVRDGIRTGVYPGAVVVVGTADSILFARGYGGLTWLRNARKPSPDSTLYDLASLTKVVATAAAVMLLVDRGHVELARPVADYLPDFVGDEKDAVTVEHLLLHSSGLRAFLPLNTLTATAPEARARVMAEPLRWPPGGRVVYSDLNAMLLGWIVEAVSGVPLDQYVQREVFIPLGMDQTRFNLPRAVRNRAAPINVWRGSPIRGVVHDQNAARLNGVAGHAGLYSTGTDLARYTQLYLRGGTLEDGLRLVTSQTVERFMQARRGNRTLGWETRDTTTSDNSGTLLSARAIGQGGFTGTSLWIDPAKDVFVVLLTNRVYAPRARRSITRLKRVRGEVADAAVRLRDRACRLLGQNDGGRC